MHTHSHNREDFEMETITYKKKMGDSAVGNARKLLKDRNKAIDAAVEKADPRDEGTPKGHKRHKN